MTVRKAIIPAAGLGTRLLPATKEQPKEMLPVLVENEKQEHVLKPFLQVIFEKLYDSNFREICFVVGRGKRSIEDHFTVDYDFLRYLQANNKVGHWAELANFYRKVEDSTIAFANQPRPLGFADAVYRAKFFSGMDNFAVHAGDDTILSLPEYSNYIKRLVSVFDDYQADATFFVQKVANPTKYGVAVADAVEDGIYHVKQVIEKPAKPPSTLALVAIYVFRPSIYQAIEQIRTGVEGEKQLTDAIQVLINQTNGVYALELAPSERRIEIGDPISYKHAFTATIELDKTSENR